MTVITLSRELGSHGEEIAALVAARLGLRLIDAESISRAAQQAGVPSRALAEMEHEGESGLANQVLKALRTMPSPTAPVEPGSPPSDAPAVALPFAGLFSPIAPPLSASLESNVRMVGLVVQGLAREGNILVMGRGGQALLRKEPGAFHVQIVAPFVYRVKSVMTAERLGKRAAENRVKADDRARADYLRRYHGVNWLDPTLYHLVVNTGCLPVEAAVELIIMAHKAWTEAAAANVEE
jgi:hypothetical protein